MPRFIPRRSHKVGLAPGSVVPVEAPPTERVRLRVIDYDRDGVRERELSSVEEALPFRDADTVTWLNVDGLHDPEVIRRLGETFDLHPLVQEDLVSTGQRPKLEDYEGHLFLVVRMLSFPPEGEHAEDEQIGLIVGPNFVLSFQEREGDVFDPVRQRIRAGKGRIRTMGPDYLAYALLDTVVDHYFLVLERLGDWMDRVEVQLIEDPGPEVMREIHALRREMLYLRKAVWPVREMVAALSREGVSMVTPAVRVYIRDVYDHTIQVIDTSETLREIVSGMLDTYLSSVSNRMNEIMKVLTIMASVFIPLTFVAGVYGMNFEWMPELTWRWAYPAVLGVMGGTAAALLYWFRRRGWL